MTKQYLFLTLVLTQATIISAFANNTRSNYLNRYSDIAVTEMQRSSIPASITLAQGILESAWGKGKLAARSNNHFGIKCKADWDGPTVPYEDDDYDANGNLIKSCFRAYDDPYDSYRDHTNFLMNRERYSELFKLHPMDYIGWAKGLKSCGYATAPDYAERLIRIIEENKLYLFDVEYIQEDKVVSAQPTAPQVEYPTTASTIMENDVEDDQEEYLDIEFTSTSATAPRQQTTYTRIYTTNMTPDPVVENEQIFEQQETIETYHTEVVTPVYLAKPVIFEPMVTSNRYQNQQQVFMAPRFDISQFVAERNNFPNSEMPKQPTYHRQQASPRPTISRVVPTEQFMNIPRQKKRTQQSTKGIKLTHIKLR